MKQRLVHLILRLVYRRVHASTAAFGPGAYYLKPRRWAKGWISTITDSRRFQRWAFGRRDSIFTDPAKRAKLRAYARWNTRRLTGRDVF